MPHCLKCGRLADLYDGICPQCATDESRHGIEHRETFGGKKRRVTPEWIAKASQRYKTQMAAAFRRAAERAIRGR